MPRRTIGRSPKAARAAAARTGSVYATCRWCGADVIWLKSTATGKLAPIDYQPSPDGNVLVHRDPGSRHVQGTYEIVSRADQATIAGVLTQEQNDAARPVLHLNHWATCNSPTARRLAKERQSGGGSLTAGGEAVGSRSVGADKLGPPMEALAAHSCCQNPACGSQLGPIDLAEHRKFHASCEPEHAPWVRRPVVQPTTPKEPTP